MMFDEVVKKRSPPVWYELTRRWSWSMEGLPLEDVIFTSLKVPLAHSCGPGVEEDSLGTGEATGWMSRRGAERDGGSSVSCNGKGRKFCRWEQKRDVVPSISSLRSQNPACKAEHKQRATWCLLTSPQHLWDGLGWDGHSWEALGGVRGKCSSLFSLFCSPGLGCGWHPLLPGLHFGLCPGQMHQGGL